MEALEGPETPATENYRRIPRPIDRSLEWPNLP